MFINVESFGGGGWVVKKEGFKKVKCFLLVRCICMLVFGIDIPLVEVVLVIGLIMFILLVEALVVIGMLMNQMNKMKQIIQLQQKMSETLLAVKKAESEYLEKLKRR